MRKFINLFLVALFTQGSIFPAEVVRDVIFHNLGPKVNSEFDEFSPTITEDGKTLIFSSYSGTRYIDLFISQKIKGKWSFPKPLTELNSPYNDETPFITPDGKWLFFASDRDGSKELPKDSVGRIRVSFDIYYSQRLPNGNWDAPSPVPGLVNNPAHQKTPSISHDGRFLFFSQWDFGNIDSSQILSSELVEGKFTEPVALPSIINSGSQDVALTPGRENQVYYFSSRRPGGYGGWDIYKTSLVEGEWTVPENAGPSINSTLHEIYYSDRGDIQFLCSNRLGGLGNYDIYSSQLLNIGIPTRFTIVDKETGKPLSKTSVTIEADTPFGKASIVKKTDRWGNFELMYDSGIDSLAISIEKKNYLPLISEIKTQGLNDENQLALTPIRKGASFEIKEILFDSNSDQIKPDSKFYLQQLASYLHRNKNLKLAIIGHTDLHGSKLFNQELSEKRAKSVFRYLTSVGLAAGRFSIEGKGESQPKVADTGPEIDQRNRRTEFKIIAK
jgi:outer membrane protein OmpA-like peptidoglycan-associated protein